MQIISILFALGTSGIILDMPLEVFLFFSFFLYTLLSGHKVLGFFLRMNLNFIKFKRHLEATMDNNVIKLDTIWLKSRLIVKLLYE